MCHAIFSVFSLKLIVRHVAFVPGEFTLLNKRFRQLLTHSRLKTLISCSLADASGWYCLALLGGAPPVDAENLLCVVALIRVERLV